MPPVIEKGFYYEFENRHRGSRSEIRGRLEIYNQTIELLELELLPRNAIDYGCGRGEWLRLLSERSWQVLGVDSNDDMLSPAQADGLTVEVGDCLSHIASQPDNSVTLITGFHIVEHLPPDVLHDFVKHAHRVVRPGGLVIFETPNPENILVGSNRFYSDPTHVHPLPPKYLEFVVEFYGFSEATCIGINQPNLRYQTGSAAAFLEMMELFPDYAVLGRKPKEGATSTGFLEFVRKTYPDSNPYSYRVIDDFIDKTHRNEMELADLKTHNEQNRDEIERLKAEVRFFREKLERRGLSVMWDRLKKKIRSQR